MSTTVSFSSSRISCESSACQPPVLDLRTRSSAYFLIVEPFLSQSLVEIIDNVFVLVHIFAVSSTSHVQSRGMTRNRKRNANQQEAASRCIRMCKTCLWIAWPLCAQAMYICRYARILAVVYRCRKMYAFVRLQTRAQRRARGVVD